MKVLLTILTVLMLVSSISLVNAQNITDTKCPESGFGSDADFCGTVDNDNDDNDKGVYACNVITDTDKFCKENLERNSKKQEDSKKHTSGIGKITVGYGDVGSYYGKGKVVIKNLDTGETLVKHDLNFAKQHHNQGPDCCEKTYTFDKSNTDKGDLIGIKVTGGGGSWTDNTGYEYKKNLRISITLDEIGE